MLGRQGGITVYNSYVLIKNRCRIKHYNAKNIIPISCSVSCDNSHQ